MNAEAKALLQRGIAELGLDLSVHQQEQFEQLLQLLQEGNARLNLTALKTEPDIVLKHFVDSVSCLRGEHLAGALKTLDLGTGGGFPTFPLAIMQPDLSLTPLDSIRKKIDFVRETAATLGFSQITPLVGRAETLGQQVEHREQYDRVVVRAVAALPILMELALPLLKVGGRLVAQKGSLLPDELSAGRRAAEVLGGQVQEIDRFALPILGDARTLVVVEKTGRTPAKYPRREGVPGAQPLFWKAK